MGNSENGCFISMVISHNLWSLAGQAAVLHSTLVKVMETWGFLSLALTCPTCGSEKRDVVALSFWFLHNPHIIEQHLATADWASSALGSNEREGKRLRSR
jgi:hypothetical protein